MPGRMLSPTMLRVTSFPFTPNNKPPLSEELKKTISESDDSMMEIEDGAELKEVNKNSQKSEETPKIKVIIKDFARQNIKEKENQPLNSNENTTEEGEETTEKSDNSEKNDQEGEDQVDCGDSTETEEEFDAPVSPPPSDSSDVILVDDDEEPPKTVEDANNSAAGNTFNNLFLESEFTPVTQSLWGCSGDRWGWTPLHGRSPSMQGVKKLQIFPQRIIRAIICSLFGIMDLFLIFRQCCNCAEVFASQHWIIVQMYIAQLISWSV